MPHTFTVVARNLLNRDNRLPSALGSVGGIPDETFNAAVRTNWRF